MNRLIALVFPLVLADCASAGTAFEWNNARKVAVGTSEAELIALLGKPNSVTTHANGQTWNWIYVSSSVFSGVGTRRVSFPLKDGKVTAIPNLAPFE